MRTPKKRLFTSKPAHVVRVIFAHVIYNNIHRSVLLRVDGDDKGHNWTGVDGRAGDELRPCGLDLLDNIVFYHMALVFVNLYVIMLSFLCKHWMFLAILVH